MYICCLLHLWHCLLLNQECGFKKRLDLSPEQGGIFKLLLNYVKNSNFSASAWLFLFGVNFHVEDRKVISAWKRTWIWAILLRGKKIQLILFLFLSHHARVKQLPLIWGQGIRNIDWIKLFYFVFLD